MPFKSDVLLRHAAILTKETQMKKLIALFVLLGVVLAAPAYSADDTQGASLWERLRKKIELLTPKKKISTTTAVGGVRGAQADADDVYWKGEAKPAPVDAEELAAFKKAMSLVDAGDQAGAQASFADFLKKHPDSRLREDAEQALAQLQAKKQ
jgi:TolA-binding protein